MDKANSNKELSDGDLSNVAGGGEVKNFAVVMSFITFGILCAGLSINAEVAHKGSCGQLMTTTRAC